jgi:hypothetical protein
MTGQQGRTVITLTEAADMIGRNYGHKPSVATVWRWARKGIEGHRLATIRIGRRYRTTISAVREFVERREGEGQPHPDAQGHAGASAQPFTKAEIAEAQRQQADEIAQAKQRLRQYRSAPSRRSRSDNQRTSPSREGA